MRFLRKVITDARIFAQFISDVRLRRNKLKVMLAVTPSFPIFEVVFTFGHCVRIRSRITHRCESSWQLSTISFRKSGRRGFKVCQFSSTNASFHRPT
eukprot:g30172.t1